MMNVCMLCPLNVSDLFLQQLLFFSTLISDNLSQGMQLIFYFDSGIHRERNTRESGNGCCNDAEGMDYKTIMFHLSRIVLHCACFSD